MVKVSIIVPVYNVEKYLDRCMDSLLNQTLKDIEIIMVDDESPDNCPMMCDEYAKKDARVKVIHKQNAGLGYARNSGLEIAAGEYVAFVDSDDFIDLGMYETLYEKASQNKLDIAFCGFNSYDHGKIVHTVSEVNGYLQYNEEDCQKVLLGMVNNCGNKNKIVKYEMSVWHGIYCRDVIERNGIKFCSERDFSSEDIIFHIDLIKECNSIGFIPQAFYYYCFNDSSLTKCYRDDRLERHDILFREIARRISFKKYCFSPKKASHLFLLKLRYDITIVASYNFDKSKQIELLDNLLTSKILHFWTKNIEWKALPFRYVVFYLCVKLKLSRMLYYIINKK